MFWLLLALIAAALLAWWRARGRVVVAVTGLTLLLYGLFGNSFLGLILSTAVWGAALLVFGLAPVRQEWLARPLLARFRRALARLNADTLAQLAVADCGREAELLDGHPDWASGPSAPPPPAQDGAHGQLAATSEPADVGTDAAEEIALSRLVWIELLRRRGTPAQQRRWLPLLSAGGRRFAACRQPCAGDGEVIALHDEQGTRLALRLRLDAPVVAAELYGLRVRLGDPRGLIGGRGGPSALLLAADTPGLLVDNGALAARGLCVDCEAVIGGLEGIGTADADWHAAHAAACVLALPKRHAQFACRVQALAAARARIHPPLGAATGNQALAQEALALLAARAGAAQALAARCARARARGEALYAPAAFVASLTAVHRAELCTAAAALGVEEGKMPACDADAEPPLLARARRYAVVVLRSHRAFVAALAAARQTNEAQALEQFDAVLRAHLGHLAHSAVRALAFGLSRSAFSGAASRADAQRAVLRHIERLSAALALVADVALTRLGVDLGSLRPLTAARAARAAMRLSLTTELGDALAHLWLASAALEHYLERGAPVAERALLLRVVGDAGGAVEEALDRTLQRLGSRWLTAIARGLVFPLGRRPRRPDDAAVRRLAQESLETERLRARLRETAPDETALVQALEATLAAEPLEARLAADATTPRLAIADALAAGRIDADQARQLEAWLAAVRALGHGCAG
jgi:acyl-CoA dehydrogenase